MSTFQVIFFIEPEDSDMDDIEIEQHIDAQNADEALMAGRRKLRDEHPDIDPANATSWFIMRIVP
jgi:hypothetical protein